jgi:hypothetical protein
MGTMNLSDTSRETDKRKGCRRNECAKNDSDLTIPFFPIIITTNRCSKPRLKRLLHKYRNIILINEVTRDENNGFYFG